MTRKRDLQARIAELEWHITAENRDYCEAHNRLSRCYEVLAERDARIAELEALVSEKSGEVIRMGEHYDELNRSWQEQYDTALAGANDLRRAFAAKDADLGEALRMRDHWHSEMRHLEDLLSESDATCDLLTAVGDRLIPDTGLARREWEVAKTGRNPRDARGRLVKVEL